MTKVGDIYPITVITYPGGDKSMELILDSHLEEYTPPVKLESLMNQLKGQTRAMEGVYAADVGKWLNGRPNDD